MSYNPSLYGAWPSGLQPAGFASATWTGAGNYYTSSGYFSYTPAVISDNSGGNTVTSGTGCVMATSLGLSQPLWALLQQAAASLDPSGALLSSWRVGIQPCAPYTNPPQSSSSPVYGRSWAGVSAWCQDGGWSAGGWQRCTTSYTATSIGAVNAIVVNSLGLNGTLPAMLSQVTSLTFIDVSRNVLTGTLPPELANISTSLRLSVFDNNLTGTVPSAYSVNSVGKLSWLAAAYNPGLYGAWPNGLQPAGFYSASYYTSGSYFAYYAANNDASTANMPTTGTGCFTGTSLGLDSPMYVTLRTIAAALDPNGTQLPSWRTGWQPCKPYGTPAQNSSSLMAGKSWVGVGSYCVDGAFAAGQWQTCSSSQGYALGGVQMLVLNSLGLGGTLPVALRELRTLTTLSVWNNSLVGSIPPEWCVWGLRLISQAAPRG